MISTCSQRYFAVKLEVHFPWRVILREDPNFGLGVTGNWWPVSVAAVCDRRGE
jgi:hypothetical protein